MFSLRILRDLAGSDVNQSEEDYVLLRLLRRDDRLSGTAIAYPTPNRLEYLLPFDTELRRRAP